MIDLSQLNVRHGETEMVDHNTAMILARGDMAYADEMRMRGLIGQ